MTLFQNIRTRKIYKIAAAYVALNLLAQICSPSVALALTNGPSQPEVQSFEPVGTTDMVDLFSGDFNYNLPLFELPGPNGGYPFNLSYHSGVGMDQEASWVGLGWNLNPGAIVRGMRGLPDDFNGQKVTRKIDRKNMVTYGVGVSASAEIAGADFDKLLSSSLKIYYNNYRGIGYSVSMGFAALPDHRADGNRVGLSLNIDSQEGIGVSPQLSLQSKIKKVDIEYGVGANLSSRSGIDLNADIGIGWGKHTYYEGNRYTSDRSFFSHGMKGSSAYSFAHIAYTPVIPVGTRNFDLSFSDKLGIGPIVYPNARMSGFYRIDRLSRKNTQVEAKAYGYDYINSIEAFENSNLQNSDEVFMNDINREKDGSLCKTSPNLAIPNLTYDYYDIQGQGIAGSFRPYRNEIGRVFDPPVYSWGAGGALNLETGAAHEGTDFELSMNISHTKPWNNDNDWSSYYFFKPLYQWDDTYADGSLAPEPLYYKSLGESTSFDSGELNYIGGEDAVRAVFDRTGSALSRKYNPIAGTLENSHSVQLTTNIEKNRLGKDRMARNTGIYPITNNDLCDAGAPVLKEYDIDYYTSVPSDGNYPLSPSHAVERTMRGADNINIESHTAGITAFNTDGNRYVYGLPVYNLSHYELSYSVPGVTTNATCQSKTDVTDDTEPDYKSFTGSENYFSETNLGPYTHSFLLTSILGTDYVDVTGDGITDDDYGYWVKFNYVKVYGDGTSSANNTTYKWRAPYVDAAYDPGFISTGKDDKSNFEYGEREMFYLATAETKTHIAVFEISKREDGLSAKGKYAGSKGSDPYYKLDEIRVYSKDEYHKLVDESDNTVKPIKTIKFKYNYDLCGIGSTSAENNNSGNAVDVNGDAVSSSSPENINSNKGKLTLKEISFEYQGSSRGSLSPYKFDYGERDVNGDIDLLNNPNYNAYAYDRWGDYRSDVDACERLNFPYVKQFDLTLLQNANNKHDFKEQVDKDAAVWCLRTISLPTGGKITVDYESDDYAYVQHKKAGQMFQIKSFYDSSNPTTLYLQSDWNTTDKWRRRIYFKLENPVKKTDASPQRFFNDYIAGLRTEDGTYQLYYKLLMKVRKDNETPEEFISGYSNLLTASTNAIDLDVSDAHTDDDYGYAKYSVDDVDGEDCYTEGFITLDFTHIRNTNSDEYHPFAVASWQFLRTNMPDLLHSFGNVTEAASNADKIVAAKSLLSFVTDFEQLFKGFRKYCFQQDYGRTVADIHQCYIRLTTPDEVKYGGGCRVKQLKISDDWNAQSGEAGSEYGQVYDYTTTDASGNTISSGVASYEPQIGGEETILRHAKHYVDEIPVFTDNDLFFEYPTNESNYPAPMVGYSKVTVKTITTQNIIDNVLTDGVRGTGAVVTEFYTAKDFPVITDETQINKKPFDLFIPIPFIGQIVTNDMTASQGYSIILNDMHGKVKSIKNYGLDAQGNLLLANALSKVEYFYNIKEKVMPDGTVASQLDNDVAVIYGDKIDSNGMLTADVNDHALVGEEYEFFTDQRQNNNFQGSAGLAFNLEIIGPAVLPFPWPSLSTHTNNVKTVATNKIIHKSGILVKTVATDAQSIVTTENKIFDGQTGRPLLVTVTNDFNNPIYRYDIPACWNFDNMGAAYRNIGFTFRGTTDNINASLNQFTVSASGLKWGKEGTVSLSASELYDILAEGDEFIITYDYNGDGIGASDPKYKCTLVERRSYCDISGNPVNSLVFHCPATLTTGRAISMILTRSGRRNLLGVNSGSIVGLGNMVTDRNYQSLSSVGYTTAALGSEIAEFLNYTLDNSGLIVYKTYNLSGSQYYDSNGEPLFPTLSSVFSSIAVKPCENGFNLVFSYRTPNGNCNQVDCGCIDLFMTGEGQVAIKGFSFDEETSSFTIDYLPGGTTDQTFELDCINLNITPVVTYTDSILNASSVVFRDYWDYDAAIGSAQTSASANLYASGKKGIWRPWKDYYYNDERYKATSSTPGTKLAGDGVFDGNGTNKYFYFFNWSPSVWTPVPSQWVPNNTITRFDQDGNEVENKDILGNYSAARFGYTNTLNTCLAANARYDEIYYESFDDPSETITLSGGTGTNNTAGNIAHTGERCVRVDNGEANKTLSLNNNLFTESKDYILSMWVARTGDPQLTYSDATDANSAGVTLTYTNLAGTTISTSSVFKPTGEVIDGWQRVEAKFTTPVNSTTGEDAVKIKINFQGGVRGVADLVSYYDDIRIFPANGNMVSYVYDPATFRLSAKLDDNNFATFYYYDEEGALFLVKQETEKGIATIQEARSHKKRQ